jgi:DNA-binding CsgD family transcriptional regulator
MDFNIVFFCLAVLWRSVFMFFSFALHTKPGRFICELETFHARLISAIPKVVPAEITTYHEMNSVKATSKNWAEPPEFGTTAWAQIWEQYMAEHPVLTYNLQTRDTRACKISDFLSHSQFHRLGLSNEFFRPMGVEDVMPFALSGFPSLVIGVGLHRSRQNFSERERRLLNLLRPHLIQAHQNAEAVTRMRQESQQARHGAEHVDRGVIILTREGRVQTTTIRARHWIAEYCGSCSGLSDSLPESLQRWVQHQLSHLYENSEVPAPPEPLVIEREDCRLVIRLLCDGEQNLLLVEEHRTRLSPASFSSLRVSPREAEVLLWLTQGRSNHDIGVILGMSERTVKRHLEHIYTKLGVWNRTQTATKALAVGLGSET